MSDLFETPEPEVPQGQNAPEFTVSELSGAVKRVIEGGIWPRAGAGRNWPRVAPGIGTFVF